MFKLTKKECYKKKNMLHTTFSFVEKEKKKKRLATFGTKLYYIRFEPVKYFHPSFFINSLDNTHFLSKKEKMLSANDVYKLKKKLNT